MALDLTLLSALGVQREMAVPQAAMTSEIQVLLMTAISIGFFHALLGPDHYLPFIVMARARDWSILRTLAITVLCGVGHVGSSLLLGMLGVALGLGLSGIEAIDATRGSLATWLLTGFGLAYGVWGLRRALAHRPHSHAHVHGDGVVHEHSHGHENAHVHVHESEKGSLTPWVLFIAFALGPCESLIPLLILPASRHSRAGLLTVAVAFALATIATMIAMVLIGLAGVRALPLRRLERFSHALAGFAILVSGLAVLLLGL
jgi:nickel/cobalt transporter (NicO) family protein